MKRRVRAFAAFWYDFIVGDDWRVAVGVMVSFTATWALSRATSIPLWWIVPVGVVTLLPVSLYRVTRAKRQ